MRKAHIFFLAALAIAIVLTLYIEATEDCTDCEEETDFDGDGIPFEFDKEGGESESRPRIQSVG